MCRDWRFTPHYGLPLMSAIISGDPKRVGSAIGDPRDAQRSCIVLHDPHLAVGAIQTVRALPNHQQCGQLSCQLAKEVPGFVKRLHTRDYCERITRPICTLCLPIPTPDLDPPSSLKSSRFPYRKVRSIKVWKHARKDQWQAELSRSVLCGSSTRAVSCQRSYHFVGAINSAFRQLTRRRTTCRSCHHALPFPPVIHPSAYGLHSCVPTWPPPIWITAIQLSSRAPWCAARRHRQLAITELGALESQFGRRLLLITSRRQPGLWI
jgi:hypothetical protein